MDYTGFPTFPIPASIRRRLPRLYLSRAGSREVTGDPRRGLESSSEPQLCHSQLVEPGVHARPATASDDLEFDLGSRGSESPPEEMGSPTKYEAESGLRWNRVVPGESTWILHQGDRLVAQLSLTVLFALKHLISSAMQVTKHSNRMRMADWRALCM